MKKRFEHLDSGATEEDLSYQALIGLGTQSARKNYYSVLEGKLAELEAERNRYKWLFENALHGIFQADFNDVGLGLAIVDRLARMLGHPIEVTSWPEHGSMFSIKIPLAEQREQSPVQNKPVLQINNLAGACILVLDNDEDILISMEVLLRQWGCVVYLVRDQYEAIELCKAESLRPDVILADYQLDDNQTGIDAVFAMRKCAGGTSCYTQRKCNSAISQIRFDSYREIAPACPASRRGSWCS